MYVCTYIYIYIYAYTVFAVYRILCFAVVVRQRSTHSHWQPPPMAKANAKPEKNISCVSSYD